MQVAIYIRVSTADGRQDTANQLIQLREFAESQGWKITKVYRDTATGKHGDREAFQAVFHDAAKKKFQVLLFWALDRFSREGVLETLRYLEKLTACGVGYCSFTERYLDSCGIFKDAVISILATVAKQERIRLSERTRAGLARMRASGKPGPNGYYQPGRPAFENEIAVKVQRMRKSGHSFSEIAHKLDISKTSAQRLARREVIHVKARVS